MTLMTLITFGIPAVQSSPVQQAVVTELITLIPMHADASDCTNPSMHVMGSSVQVLVKKRRMERGGGDSAGHGRVPTVAALVPVGPAAAHLANRVLYS